MIYYTYLHASIYKVGTTLHYYLHNKLSTHNTIRKYFVGNLVTAAPPQYSPAIRLWRKVASPESFLKYTTFQAQNLHWGHIIRTYITAT